MKDMRDSSNLNKRMQSRPLTLRRHRKRTYLKKDRKIKEINGERSPGDKMIPPTKNTVRLRRFHIGETNGTTRGGGGIQVAIMVGQTTDGLRTNKSQAR